MCQCGGRCRRQNTMSKVKKVEVIIKNYRQQLLTAKYINFKFPHSYKVVNIRNFPDRCPLLAKELEFIVGKNSLSNNEMSKINFNMKMIHMLDLIQLSL